MKKFLLLCLMFLLCGCQQSTPLFEGQEEIKMIVASDLHYYAPELYDECSWFETALLNSDGQMPHMSKQIVDCFVSEVIQQNPDIVVLSGDLTFNGEKIGHEQLAASLQPLLDNGIEVAVINGNHDINNMLAREYLEEEIVDVESITADDFKHIYKDFGYSNAISKDSHSLSYQLSLNENYDLLVVDSCSTDYYQTGSKLEEETLTWMESRLKESTENNKQTIVMMHHNLGIHCEAIYNGYVLYNASHVKHMLDQYNVPVVLSGHMHTQHTMAITEDMTEIVSGALDMSPVQYGVLTLTEDSIDYQTKEVESITEDETFFITTSINRFASQLTETLDEQTAQEIATYVSEINAAYFGGYSADIAETYKADPLYEKIRSLGDSAEFVRQYLNIMLNETENHQSLHITLK